MYSSNRQFNLLRPQEESGQNPWVKVHPQQDPLEKMKIYGNHLVAARSDCGLIRYAPKVVFLISSASENQLEIKSFSR